MLRFRGSLYLDIEKRNSFLYYTLGTRAPPDCPCSNVPAQMPLCTRVQLVEVRPECTSALPVPSIIHKSSVCVPVCLCLCALAKENSER